VEGRDLRSIWLLVAVARTDALAEDERMHGRTFVDEARHGRARP
jgi:hypothetical protein